MASLKGKITVWISLLILVIGSFTVAGVVLRIQQEEIHTANHLLEITTIQRAREVASHLFQTQQVVHKISENQEVKKLLTANSEEEKEAVYTIIKQNNILENYNITGAYSSIYIMDMYGETLIATDSTFEKNNYGFRNYFKDAMAGRKHLSVAIGATTFQPGFYHSAPVRGNQGEIVGIAVIKESPNILFDYFRTELSEGEVFYFTTKEGVIIFSSDQNSIYKTIGDLSTQEKTRLTQNRSFPGLQLSSLGLNALKSHIADQQYDISLEITDKDKTVTNAAISQVGDFNFFVITQKKTNTISQLAFREAVFMGGAIALAIFLVIILIPIIVSKLLTPLSKLSHFADEISRGNLNHRLDIHTNTEFDILALSFNKMAKALSETRNNIEKEIKERTIDLKKFQQAVEHSSDQIVITDTDGIVVYANRAVEKVTGFTKNEIIGKKAGSPTLWGGLMDASFYQSLWETIKVKTQTFEGEIRNKRKSGEEYYAEVKISPILDEDTNKPVLFVSIERDITKAKEVDRMKTEFISLASHQLRTPLSAVKWFIEMLLSGDAGELNNEQRDMVQNVNTSNERMIDLVNSLLNISRIESGRIIIDPEPTNLKELVDGVITELQPKLHEKNQSVIISADPNLPAILIDGKLIRNVLINLLTNAIKYSPSDSEIIVFISKDTKNVIVQVADSGLGIPEADQDNVFKKFYRAKNVVQQETEGNGLGLYLAKAIIESSQGKIWFKSVENQGTSFFFTLPLSGSKPQKGEVTLDS